MRIKRNLRLVVPQYYRDEIMYLVPIRIPTLEDSFETMALAVEKTATSQYRANTIFTKGFFILDIFHTTLAIIGAV